MTDNPKGDTVLAEIANTTMSKTTKTTIRFQEEEGIALEGLKLILRKKTNAGVIRDLIWREGVRQGLVKKAEVAEILRAQKAIGKG